MQNKGILLKSLLYFKQKFIFNTYKGSESFSPLNSTKSEKIFNALMDLDSFPWWSSKS